MDSFTLFPQLPPEIRLRIWDLTLPSSRLIPIRCGYDPSPSSTSVGPGCFSPASIPPSLQACIESRQHALSTRYTHSLSMARSPARVLLDHESDVLYFPPKEGYMAASAEFHTFLSLCNQTDLARLRRIALHESGLAVGLTVECLARIRDRMPAIEQIIFVCASHEDGGDDDAPARLRAQIHTAMSDLAASSGGKWTPPIWTIVAEP
ncbi:hypothetical protein GMORB2_6795 [Geosmithia morbida]|uniref:2EXR domain-containing protein n=1 Tax=Geosmithia morbida TaxID=1094350 RepID=A0A9P5D4Z0_9HYPO|nr:uncharacterized protein GMORB2_6795 [Geosmithia morbida]KAF4123245.1 hypothetical protein GMORB2_6795 [Geosmithia morbida]